MAGGTGSGAQTLRAEVDGNPLGHLRLSLLGHRVSAGLGKQQTEDFHQNTALLLQKLF